MEFFRGPPFPLGRKASSPPPTAKSRGLLFFFYLVTPLKRRFFSPPPDSGSSLWESIFLSFFPMRLGTACSFIPPPNKLSAPLLVSPLFLKKKILLSSPQHQPNVTILRVRALRVHKAGGSPPHFLPLPGRRFLFFRVSLL